MQRQEVADPISILFYLSNKRCNVIWSIIKGEEERERQKGKKEGRTTFPSLPCSWASPRQLDLSSYHWIWTSRKALQRELIYWHVPFFLILDLFLA